MWSTTDTGVDDALALMLLAADPEVEILAVISVFGNTTGERAADNARYVLDTCGRTDVPVYRGADVPIVQELRMNPGIHGEDGFGNTGLRPARSVPAEPRGVPILLDLGGSVRGGDRLSRPRPADETSPWRLEAEPELLTRLRSTTIVGTLGPALYHDTAPWRIGDSASRAIPTCRSTSMPARMVARHQGDVTWCGPYVTRQALVPEDFFLEIASTTGFAPAQLITEISRDYAGFYSRSYPQPEGRRVMGINDSMAVASLLHPELVTGAVMRPLETFFDEETGDRFLAGVHPVKDETRPIHRVIFDMDFDGVLERIGEVLRRPLPWR